MKERLDRIVTERRLIRSRSRAQRMIMAGRVRADGQTIYRPGHMIDTEAEVEIVAQEPFVSRGGEKLAPILDTFRISPRGVTCLDVGSSTGGFTDCLLQRGARRVHCVDVGKGQLDWRLRNDPRVVVHEGINARFLTVEDVGESPELATVDVSFISLRLVLPPLAPILSSRSSLVVLVKPQFEAGRDRVERGGVVRNPDVHTEILEGLHAFVDGATPWSVAAAAHSPLLGPAGNVEFFLLLGAVEDEGDTSVDLPSVVASAHATLREASS